MKEIFVCEDQNRLNRLLSFHIQSETPNVYRGTFLVYAGVDSSVDVASHNR